MESIRAHVSSALGAGEYSGIGNYLDHEDLKDSSLFESPEWPYLVHILAHAFGGHLENARFVYKRLPEAARLNANVQAAFTVLQHLWGRHYTKLWSCLEWEWPSEVQGLVATMRVRLQEHMMDLVARAYTSVAVSQLANLVGMIEAEARQAALARGWAEDESNASLLLPRAPAAAQPHAATEADLLHLAEYVVHLQADEGATFSSMPQETKA